MSKEWICRVCHKLIMDGKCDCAALPPVRSEPLLALWDAAFASFKAAADATKIGDIPGGGLDRAARMWTDFEKIIEHLKANVPASRVEPAEPRRSA